MSLDPTREDYRTDLVTTGNTWTIYMRCEFGDLCRDNVLLFKIGPTICDMTLEREETGLGNIIEMHIA